MNKTKKLLISILLIISLSIISLSSIAYAEENNSSQRSAYIEYWDHQNFDFDTIYFNKKTEYHFYNVELSPTDKLETSSSNNKVMKIKTERSENRTSASISIIILKTGTSTIKVGVYDSNGTKKASTSKKIKVKKYNSNPFSSLKIGKKNYTKIFNTKKIKYRYYWRTLGSGVMAITKIENWTKINKITIKLKKGYELLSITRSRWDVAPEEYKIFNGKKFKMEDSDVIYVRFKDKNNKISKLCIYNSCYK